MTAVVLDQVSGELVSLQPSGAELRLGPVTEDLALSEQTGDMTVSVNATLQNVDDIGDGRDLWSALGGDGGRFRIDASWDGQTVQSVWEGSAWDVRLRSTGRDRIELVAYDDLRRLVTDEIYVIGPNGPAGEAANSWIARILGDGGPPAGDVSQPTAKIRQYIFAGQPRAQIVDQILRWAFFRTPKTNADGSANPDKVPYMLQMRKGDGGWTANTIKPGTNSLVFGFDETTCADLDDHQSIEQLVLAVTLYSTAALVQGAAPNVEPYPGALTADFQVQHVPGAVAGQQVTQIVQSQPSYTPPANLGPLRRVLGGGGADNPQVLTEMAEDTLAIFGLPWKVRTVVVPLLPMIRRGDRHHFSLKGLDDFYVVTGVVHSWAKRQTILTLDTSGVLGRRVSAQSTIGVQGPTGAEQGAGDTAGAAPTAAATGTAQGAIAAATDPQLTGRPYVFGGPEGRTAMDPAASFTSSDCSGFVAWAYFVGTNGAVDLRDGTGVSTMSLHPKTTAVPADQARPGDLVFYNMNQSDMRLQHVALYLGDGRKAQEGGSGRGVNTASVTDIGTPEYRRLAA